MIGADDFSRSLHAFCRHPEMRAEMAEIVRAFPYFQIARLMECFGTKDSDAVSALALRMEDRCFLYQLFSGKKNPVVEEAASRLEAVSAGIPKEINSEGGRSALQVLNDMLEQFKTNPPKLNVQPSELHEEDVYEDLGKSSNMERMNYVSETLARLYVEQKEYDRAIKIYKVLSEKHPEKSAGYAAAIDEIKLLKNG